MLREDPAKPSKRRGKTTYVLQVEDEDLMEALRELRKRLADEADVPPYVVFHDATLVEMIERRPTTLAEMSEINGVGQAKLTKYGDTFLEVIAEHVPQTSNSGDGS